MLSRVPNLGSIYGELAPGLEVAVDSPNFLGDLGFHCSRGSKGGGGGGLAVDILDARKAYVFYIDVPGLSKADMQVTVEDENTLVVKSNGKRKREDEEACKYLKFERRVPQNLTRKFRLPENSNTEAITANCEDGVLTVTVEKNLPPPPKSRIVEISVA